LLVVEVLVDMDTMVVVVVLVGFSMGLVLPYRVLKQ
jgi:hypothetical protein